jgi:dUTP pyrophosphatase
MIVKVKKLNDRAVVPTKGSEQAAGSDLYALLDEPVTLNTNESVFIPTGIAIELPKNFAGFIFARSGLACKHGISPANCVGVVDSDYRGEIKVCLVNNYKEPYTIEPGERIAQLVIMPVENATFLESDSLNDTGRASGGFGSTGRI